jgi:hypothetical protein
MYRHILLAVALQQWDEFSPHAVAAREAAVALAKGSGAHLSRLNSRALQLDGTGVARGREAANRQRQAMAIETRDSSELRDARHQKSLASPPSPPSASSKSGSWRPKRALAWSR